MTLTSDTRGTRLHAGTERHGCSSQKQAMSIELIVDLPPATCMVLAALDQVCPRHGMQNLDMDADLFGGHEWICAPQQETQCKAACSRADELNLAGGRLDAAARDRPNAPTCISCCAYSAKGKAGDSADGTSQCRERTHSCIAEDVAVEGCMS